VADSVYILKLLAIGFSFADYTTQNVWMALVTLQLLTNIAAREFNT